MKFNKRKTFLALTLLSVMNLSAQVTQTGLAGDVEVRSSFNCAGDAAGLTAGLSTSCTDVGTSGAVDVTALQVQSRLELGKLKSVVIYKPQQEGDLGTLDLADLQLNADIDALEGASYVPGTVYRCDGAVTGTGIQQLHTGANTGLGINFLVSEGVEFEPVAPNGAYATTDSSTAICILKRVDDNLDPDFGKVKIVLHPFMGMNMRIYGYEDSMELSFSNADVRAKCFAAIASTTHDQIMAHCPIMTIRAAGVDLSGEIAEAKPYDNTSAIDLNLEDLQGISSQTFRILETQILARENMVQGLIKVSAFVPVEFDVEAMRAAPGSTAVSTFQTALELNVSSNYFVAGP